MPLADLTERERTVILECLRCVAAGKVIKHDLEFHTLFGIEVTELISVLDAWPDVDESDTGVALAINNSMLHLLGYPHGYHDKWGSVMSIPLDEIAAVLHKWRDMPRRTYFDFLM